MLRRVSELSDYWTTGDIAAYLGIKPSTLTSYVARGMFIPPAAVMGRTKLWKRDEVIAWAARRPRKGPPS